MDTVKYDFRYLTSAKMSVFQCQETTPKYQCVGVYPSFNISVLTALPSKNAKISHYTVYPQAKGVVVQYELTHTSHLYTCV